ncbi:phage tail tube protein [Peribacillus huizhouensis]|uniref:Phage portal protein n=1 Tax=Peribacillus huizhouensis TaxID=1501239 RepID=A0ABR6CR51_9BACI|nr:phage tail tube protein [Peribacillus huizhouensis]MBA9027517.1 hypothetical protein [Peribacillus huizhouensis]
MTLDSTKTLNGSFGKMYSADGEWLTNVQSAEAQGEITKEEVHRAGTRVTGHKVTGITYSGAMTGYKVTTKLAKQIAQVANDSKGSFVTELVMKLDDPESADKAWVRLKGVQFDSIPILKYEMKSLVMEETPFTFSGFEYL